MSRKYVKVEEIKTRAYKLLLYPDNMQHMRVLHTLKNHPVYSKYYVGIWHKLQDEKTNEEVMKGHGKKHTHIIVNLPNPVWWSSFCNNLGVQPRFCMPISVEIEEKTGKFYKDGRSSVDRGYVYLIHLNAPDKEEYTVNDLWGAQEMIENAISACDVYLMRNISMSRCVFMALDWIRSQESFISWSAFADWICKTPYFKAQSSPLVRAVLDEHNKSAIRSRAKSDYADKAAAVAASPEMHQKAGAAGCVVFNLDEFIDSDELPDYRYFDNGGIMV